MLNKSSVNYNSSLLKQSLIKIQSKQPLKNVKKSNTNKTFHKYELKSLKLIGQFDKKFLITHNPETKDIVIFDQHAVHERILYEFYTNLLKSEITNSTNKSAETPIRKNLFRNIYTKLTLTVPISLELKRDLNINSNRVNSLFFFDFIKKDNLIKLYSVPIIFDRTLTDNVYVELFTNLIESLECILDKDYNVCNINTLIDIYLHLIKSKACRDAIKFNDILEETTMRELVNNLKTCLDPFLCAHGRHNFFIITKLN
jgi:DNA mismatch repair protein MutL